MKLPSSEDILALHHKYAPSEAAFDLVYTHCLIVAEIAKQLLAKSELPIDREFVRAACLLHDIGVYRLYLPSGEIDHANYIRHGVLGHEILQWERFDEDFCRVASCHTGVGLTREDIISQQLPLPAADYIARSAEERLVMYADKFHTKSNPPKFMTAESYAAQIGKFGAHKAEQFRGLVAEFGEPDLEQLAKIYDLAII